MRQTQEFCVRAVLALLLPALAGCAGSSVSQSSKGNCEAILNTPVLSVGWMYSETPFSDEPGPVNWYANPDVEGASVVFDVKRLGRVKPVSWVTPTRKAVPLREAFAAACKANGLACRVVDGILYISTPDAIGNIAARDCERRGEGLDDLVRARLDGVIDAGNLNSVESALEFVRRSSGLDVVSTPWLKRRSAQKKLPALALRLGEISYRRLLDLVCHTADLAYKIQDGKVYVGAASGLPVARHYDISGLIAAGQSVPEEPESEETQEAEDSFPRESPESFTPLSIVQTLKRWIAPGTWDDWVREPGYVPPRFPRSVTCGNTMSCRDSILYVYHAVAVQTQLAAMLARMRWLWRKYGVVPQSEFFVVSDLVAHYGCDELAQAVRRNVGPGSWDSDKRIGGPWVSRSGGAGSVAHLATYHVPQVQAQVKAYLEKLRSEIKLKAIRGTRR